MKLEERQREQFREKQRERFSSRQVEKDLFQSQKACEQLDKAKVRKLFTNNGSAVIKLKHGMYINCTLFAKINTHNKVIFDKYNK